jgi:hypothetical protein
MKHAVAEFVLFKDGEEVHVKTREYNFEIEEIIKERIGEEKFNAYQATGKLEINITLDAVKNDFPKLLTGSNLDKVDWKKQNYDTLQDIYFFFIRYRKNASLRRLEYEKETLLSNLELMEKLILSMPENILTKLNLKRTNGS